MRNKALTNGILTFEVKLVMPNDSYCSQEWWVPTHFPKELDVTWMVMEKGGYVIGGTQTVVGYGNVTGKVQNLIWPYTFGTCHDPPEEGDNDYAPGAIVTLQTSNNVDMFLLCRSPAYWFKEDSCTYSWKSGRFFLQGHDGLSPAARELLNDEILGYLLFDPKPHIIQCADETTMEFNGFSPVSNDIMTPSLSVPYSVSTGGIFGVFGSLVTYTGGDAFAIRSFFDGNTTDDLFVYLQVWRCVVVCVCM